MWAEELVPAERVEIYTGGFDVDGSVRCKGYCIYAEHCLGNRVDCICYSANVGDTTEDVGGVSAGDEDRVGREEWLESVGCELRI